MDRYILLMDFSETMTIPCFSDDEVFSMWSFFVLI